MYGDVLKPKLESYKNPEQLILSRLESFDDQYKYHEIQKFLAAYKDSLENQFGSEGETKKKISDFEERLKREKGVVSADYVLLWLLKNTLLNNSPLPDVTEKKEYKFDKDGIIAEEILKEFVVPQKIS